MRIFKFRNRIRIFEQNTNIRIFEHSLNILIRKKFRNDRPERSETFIQLGSRLRSYLNRWINMAKIENTFEAICDFMARDQFLESCSRELFKAENVQKFG